MLNTPLLMDKVALITGASRGIGEATARTLAAAGATVILVARTTTAIAPLAAELQGMGQKALALAADISQPAEVEQLYQTACQQVGAVDILVNNAAQIQPIDMVWQSDPTAWATLMQVNLLGPYLCSRIVLPEMIARRQGWIIHISSGAAASNIEGASAYCASKAALERFSGVLAAEVSHHQIVVTTLRPGIVQSDMQSELRAASTEQLPRVGLWQQWHEQGQLRPPNEPAQAILWLASRFAQGENGQVFSLDDADFRQQIAADLGLPLMAGRER